MGDSQGYTCQCPDVGHQNLDQLAIRQPSAAWRRERSPERLLLLLSLRTNESQPSRIRRLSLLERARQERARVECQEFENNTKARLKSRPIAVEENLLVINICLKIFNWKGTFAFLRSMVLRLMSVSICPFRQSHHFPPSRTAL